ncbi:MFS transporter [Rhodococcus opacus]|uniref:MFS transporter n=1 Tax=Rhodococcus opacus TaxID=37919 RepID=UPI001C440CEA|nr:MFS transporter [Rhodococcus opacus]MBV6759087.1 MFS transporter [Rhodococcus opacus]
MDVSSAVAQSRMTFRQYLVIFGAMLCNLVDGYDLSVVGFALPHLPDGFASAAVKGWLISTGLIGMAVGAILVAPLADRFGRRTLLIAGVALNLVAMIGTALAPNVEVMFGTRFLTGVAVGVLSTLSILIAQEYAAADKRNLAAGLVTIGFSVGTIGGGIIGLSLVNALGGGWQIFFWAGAVLTAVILVFIVCLMPESLSFLVAQGTPEAKRRIAKIATQMGLRDVDPDAKAPVDPKVSRVDSNASLLGSVFRKRSLLLWSAYAVLTAAYYFVASWTPQLIANESGSADVGTTVGTLISFGAMIGAITFGIIGIRMAATHLGWIFLAIAIGSQIVFAMTMDGGVAMAAAAVLGFAAFASMTSYVSAAPQLYPVQLRSRGLGYMYGISRFGSILAPIVAGYAITVVSGRTMYLAASLLFAIAFVLTFALWRITRSQLAPARAPESATESATASA